MNNIQLKLAFQIGGDEWWDSDEEYITTFMGHYCRKQNKGIGISQEGKIYLTRANYNDLHIITTCDNKEYQISLKEAKQIMKKELKLKQLNNFE